MSKIIIMVVEDNGSVEDVPKEYDSFYSLEEAKQFLESLEGYFYEVTS